MFNSELIKQKDIIISQQNDIINEYKVMCREYDEQVNRLTKEKIDRLTAEIGEGLE